MPRSRRAPAGWRREGAPRTQLGVERQNMAAHAGTVLNVAVSSEKGLPCPVPSSANNGSSRTSSLTRHQEASRINVRTLSAGVFLQRNAAKYRALQVRASQGMQ